MSIRDRLRRLEDATLGDCPRCSDSTAIIVCGEVKEARVSGSPVSPELWRAHEAEEADGKCPVCGREPIEITVGWPEDL